MGGKCFFCRPVLRWTEGADHHGDDYFLRCPKCGTRTICHVEGYPSERDRCETILRKEWREGRINGASHGK